ncbi:photosystem II PsbW protein [Pseudoscourfieldia marina]
MMSTRLSSCSVRAPVSAISARKHCVVRASSSSSSPAKASVASVASLVALPVVASISSFAAPALALVDDRMNGDGVGLPLGINDPALAIALASVATFVWSQYYLSQRDLGGDKGDDSGLSL